MASAPDPSSIEKELRERIEKEIREKRKADDGAAGKDTTAEPAKPADTPAAAETPEQRRARMEAEMRAKLDAEVSAKRVRPEAETPPAAEPPAPAADAKAKAIEAAKAKAIEEAKAKAIADAKAKAAADGAAKAADAKAADGAAKGEGDVVFRQPDAAPEKPKRSINAGGKKSSAAGKKGGGPKLKGAPKAGAKVSLGTGTKSKTPAATGTKTKTKGPAAAPSARSKQEAHLAAEKARINKALKTKMRILYAAITVFTIAAFFGFQIWQKKNKKANDNGYTGPGDPEWGMEVPDDDSNSPAAANQSSHRDRTQRPAPVVDNRSPLEKAMDEARQQAADNNFDDAIAALIAYRHANPTDAMTVNETIDEIVSGYVDDGNAPASWEFTKSKVDELLEKPNADNLAAAMAELRSFQSTNPSHAFIAEPRMLALANQAYSDTNRFLVTGPDNEVPTGYARPWAKNGNGDDAPQQDAPKKNDGGNDGGEGGFNFEL